MELVHRHAASRLGRGRTSGLWRTTMGTAAGLQVADDRVVLVTVVEGGVAVEPADLRMIAFDTRTATSTPWPRGST
jgi:hypothetical protein